MRLLTEALRRIISKPFTIKYPKKKPEIADGFRGKHVWYERVCIFCLMCERSCPTGAITIDKEKKTYTIDFSKCIFCGRCEDVCPVGAINLTKRYEMATDDKESLKERL